MTTDAQTLKMLLGGKKTKAPRKPRKPRNKSARVGASVQLFTNGETYTITSRDEKYWKKDGLNPIFPLAGLMLLIRSHPVRPAERPPGAPTMCTPRGCVVVWCAPECTRGDLVCA